MIKQINQIKGLEYIKDYYYVSDFGKVFSIRTGRPKILKPGKTRDGYLQVCLYANDVKKKMYVHRLVAMAFIDNSENKPQINHKNECRSCNRFYNLEWYTSKENNNYGNHNKKISGSNHSKAKSKEYYKTHTSIRCNFKTICKKQGWNFNDFEEIDSGEKYRTHKKFYYIEKE